MHDFVIALVDDSVLQDAMGAHWRYPWCRLRAERSGWLATVHIEPVTLPKSKSPIHSASTVVNRQSLFTSRSSRVTHHFISATVAVISVSGYTASRTRPNSPTRQSSVVSP